MGRCGGEGRRLRAHEVMKRVLKELVLTNSNPGGSTFPSSSIMAEPPHDPTYVRTSPVRETYIMALGRGVDRLNIAMGIVAASSITKSFLSST